MNYTAGAEESRDPVGVRGGEWPTAGEGVLEWSG